MLKFLEIHSINVLKYEGGDWLFFRDEGCADGGDMKTTYL